MALHKKWIFLSLLSILASLGAITGINYFIDPLWTFEHHNKYNDYQRGRKERQQKSNALYFRTKKYDTLIFGSSRVTHMDAKTFGKHTFNYAVSDMQANEYNDYLDFAIYKAKQPIKRVIIGLDFFGALTYTPFIAKEPQTILKKITQAFYKYKLLFSLDTLSYSLQNIKYSYKKTDDTYTYSYIKRPPTHKRVSLKKFNASIDNGIKIYARDRYSKSYDKQYKNKMLTLIKNHPNIDFIVFTTPVSEKHFQSIISYNLYSQYKRWLRESVEVFENVHNFMYINELTHKANIYFFDSNHMYNSSYKCLANELLGEESKCPRVDMLLTQKNLKSKLQELKN